LCPIHSQQQFLTSGSPSLFSFPPPKQSASRTQ
jgi:hypothetical protein